MPTQTTYKASRRQTIPGLAEEAFPLLSLGLGLTGLALGFRPRLAPIPLTFTVLTALLYRDPPRRTPDEPGALFAVSDGVVLAVNECYEHRYLHTDAIRITTVLSPFDVPVSRSPVHGMVQYVEHVAGEYRPTHSLDAAEYNTRTYIGLQAAWGPVLVVQVAGPVARQIISHVQPGDRVEAGERISTARFGARTDLFVQRDSINPLVEDGQRLLAGMSRLARIVPI